MEALLAEARGAVWGGIAVEEGDGDGAGAAVIFADVDRPHQIVAGADGGAPWWRRRGAQWTEAVTVGAEDVGKDVGVARSLLPGAAADPFHPPRAPPPVGFPIRAAIANCR